MQLTLYRLLAFGLASLVLSLILTPLVRELNRRLGMVDKPDARRINKVPIPRGGGVAVFLSVALVQTVVYFLYGAEIYSDEQLARFPVFLALGFSIVLLGYADDKWSLSPKVKLLGQTLVAFAAWGLAGIGFAAAFPELPAWLDCLLTVGWYLGAINAFNLIDGLDGLAAGLAVIAVVGMAGALVFVGAPGSICTHVVFVGALLGFLRYNYNPASVFLGDSGSMFIGFIVASLPLVYHTTHSFFVSVGVPLLAMGVPIFDTSLAILRRSIRHFLVRRGTSAAGNDKVMTADTDHLHHRILRASGLSQRKAAWALYGFAFFLVLFAFGNLALTARRSVLWLIGLTIASVIVVRNFSRIELYDAARLLGEMAHDRTLRARRKYQRLALPLVLVGDLLVLVGSFFAISWIVRRPLDYGVLTLALPIQVISTFAALVFFRVYVTVWSRAVLSNYLRLFAACVFGTVIGVVGIYVAPGLTLHKLRVAMPLFVLLPFIGFCAIRLARPVLRDLFYALDCRRLITRKDVSRVLVYGAGLRYGAFRRELVRSASANRRIIVGLIDDDILLRGLYIGGVQIKGTINEAREIINALNVNEIVITSIMTEEWLKVVLKVLRPTGVKVTQFRFEEKELG